MNSRQIVNATEHYNLGHISEWQFLNQCLYLSVAYEAMQRLYAFLNEDDDDEMDNDDFGEEQQVIENIQPVEVELPAELPLNVAIREPAPGTSCFVCMVSTTVNSEQQFVVLPCFHGWICGDCVANLEGPNSVCPMCRMREVVFKRIFFG